MGGGKMGLRYPHHPHGDKGQRGLHLKPCDPGLQGSGGEAGELSPFPQPGALGLCSYICPWIMYIQLMENIHNAPYTKLAPFHSA